MVLPMTPTNYNRTIVSRADARKKGMAKYYNGKICNNGHKVQRYVESNNCVLCQSGIPVISKHLYNMAKAQADIKGIKHQTISRRKDITIINP